MSPRMRKAHSVRIGEHFDRAPRADLRLHLAPPARIEQIRMECAEALARLRVGEEKLLELLGEYIAPSDRVPDFVGHLIPVRRLRRNRAEVAVDEVLDLVVVVE